MPAPTSATGGASGHQQPREGVRGQSLQVTWPGHVAVRPGGGGGDGVEGAGCTMSVDTITEKGTWAWAWAPRKAVLCPVWLCPHR
ncbi:hypothetical protein E2C01_095187 [Portunus trituberculatus]|uniref:Uncharacterized protein n=1 Tax=Portunus trituberculatus TaxID=210409 RepID=A0A5B7JZB6_PORTR|nr:hypothetical protein [Portunus trituberculatus]